MTVQDDIQVST